MDLCYLYLCMLMREPNIPNAIEYLQLVKGNRHDGSPAHTFASMHRNSWSLTFNAIAMLTQKQCSCPCHDAIQVSPEIQPEELPKQGEATDIPNCVFALLDLFSVLVPRESIVIDNLSNAPSQAVKGRKLVYLSLLTSTYH